MNPYYNRQIEKIDRTLDLPPPCGYILKDNNITTHYGMGPVKYNNKLVLDCISNK